MKISDLIDVNKLCGNQKKSVMKNAAVYSMLYDVSDVTVGYSYFQNFLFEKLIKIFQYSNLPESIPSDALEDIILHEGFVGIVNTTDYGLVAVPIQKYGVGLYKRYQPTAVYATPLVKGKGYIGKDIATIKNNSYELSCKSIVDRYARMLADTESTLSNVLYNMRMPSIPSFPSEEMAESYKAVSVANRLGQTDAVLNKQFIGEIGAIPNFSNMNSNTMTELITARQDLLRMFLSEIGINTANEKRERMTKEEVNSNSQLLLFNVRDMLDCRKKGVEQINQLFKTNIKVELTREYELLAYKPIEKEVEKNGNADNPNDIR